ncbi:MAG TPA: Asp-tRNA(Asn)/Glu-tRNA(Gln) amidotransferase subunit GatC [Terracidiphilus sp.]|jgi:aspartyl-tRNA(Asn)/glutamyl-tRNA(Gln) amidotransferase subunit C
MTAKVSLDEVERVAELAHLKLTPDETQGMLHDLNEILDYIAQLNELDTDSIAPLSQVSELEGAGGSGALRNDAIQPSLDRAVVMPEAPETNGVFFKVPKVIER